MTALKVIGIILLIFLLIGFLRVGALLRFGQELNLRLSVGPFRFTLLPAKEKKETAQEAAKTKKGEEKCAEKKKRGLPKLTKEEKKDLISTALSALRESARRACKRLRIDPLEILVVFGGSDPAEIAQTYGYANAVMWGLMPHLEDIFLIPEPSLHLRMDYSAEKTRAEGSVGCSLRIRDGLRILIALLWPLLKWYLRYKKAHKNDAPAEKPTESAQPNHEHNEKMTA